MYCTCMYICRYDLEPIQVSGSIQHALSLSAEGNVYEYSTHRVTTPVSWSCSLPPMVTGQTI